MLSLKYKDIRRREVFYKNEIEKNALKFFIINILNNKKISGKLKKKLFFFYKKRLFKTFAKTSKTKIQRRCIITNRAKVSNSFFGISRVKLKEFLAQNVFFGFSRAVW